MRVVVVGGDTAEQTKTNNPPPPGAFGVNLGHRQFIFAGPSPENELRRDASWRLRHAKRSPSLDRTVVKSWDGPPSRQDLALLLRPVRSSSSGLNYEEFIWCILLVFSIGSAWIIQRVF